MVVLEKKTKTVTLFSSSWCFHLAVGDFCSVLVRRLKFVKYWRTKISVTLIAAYSVSTWLSATFALVWCTV